MNTKVQHAFPQNLHHREEIDLFLANALQHVPRLLCTHISFNGIELLLENGCTIRIYGHALQHSSKATQLKIYKKQSFMCLTVGEVLTNCIILID